MFLVSSTPYPITFEGCEISGNTVSHPKFDAGYMVAPTGSRRASSGSSTPRSAAIRRGRGFMSTEGEIMLAGTRICGNDASDVPNTSQVSGDTHHGRRMHRRFLRRHLRRDRRRLQRRWRGERGRPGTDARRLALRRPGILGARLGDDETQNNGPSAQPWMFRCGTDRVQRAIPGASRHHARSIGF